VVFDVVTDFRSAGAAPASGLMSSLTLEALAPAALSTPMRSVPAGVKILEHEDRKADPVLLARPRVCRRRPSH